MSFSDNSNMVMPVSPMYGGGYGGGGFGGWSSDFWLIIIVLMAFGGFGGWGMGGFGGAGNMMLGYDFPWLLNGQNGINANTNAGFAQAATQGAISGIQNSITSGFGDVQTALCGGFAGVNQNISSTGSGIVNALNAGFNGAEVANNARQIANMQQAFNAQVATTSAINGVQNQIAQGNSDNKAGIESIKYTVATENCADRYEAAQNTRDIMENCNRNNQAIMDKLCQLELDNYKGQLAQAQRENVGLQNQLNMAALRESQTAQNALIQQGFSNEVDQLYNRLNSCPVPTTPVYGRTPIFTCNGQPSYNCGCNGLVA